MQEVQGGISGEGAAGFLDIAPDEPGGELSVESVEVVGEMLIGQNEAIPQGAVEALVSPVLLEAGGEDEEAAQPQMVGQAVKISLEFSPVVGEQGEDGDRAGPAAGGAGTRRRTGRCAWGTPGTSGDPPR